MKTELTPATAVASTMTTGDARRMILETIMQLKNGNMDVNRGMAIAANMKVLNDSIFAEVAAAKMAASVSGEAHNFGKVIEMGKRQIAG